MKLSSGIKLRVAKTTDFFRDQAKQADFEGVTLLFASSITKLIST
ncbi:hypothetical protein MC7420_7832 [Coleofasciculus chthonoplastes PCC 7420]|jgi:hypothetical protein|uniref:Uncharacterized protein n=1 Tax=Coleofasciculus chthonoplastes PCC 7420 TaxID=118168 RepID=B4VIK9_9CYAN|nr:hypothetical protein MC7420_7832 [Coleofasciculus chthonoplastes PCC 7420]